MLGLPSVPGLQVTAKQVVSNNLAESCAVLLADGTVYTRGRNDEGELDDGTTTQPLTPVPGPCLRA